MGPCSAPRLLYSVSVSHSAYSVGASNCSLGSTGQKRPNPTNKQYLRRSPALRGSHCAHSHTLQAARSPLNQPPNSVAVAIAVALHCGRLWQLLLLLPAPTPTTHSPVPAPAPACCTCTKFFSSLLGLRPTFSHLAPKIHVHLCPVGSIIRWCDFFILPHLYFPVVTWTRRKTGRLTPTGH